MIRRKRFWFAVASLLIAGLLAFANHWAILGWLRGESFYEGWPTSYWDWELQQWDIVSEHVPIWRKRETAFERLRGSLGLPSDRSPFDWPPLLKSDPAGESVLRELLSSSSETVRRRAREALENMGRK